MSVTRPGIAVNLTETGREEVPTIKKYVIIPVLVGAACSRDHAEHIELG